jgi:hypothetical protein
MGYKYIMFLFISIGGIVLLLDNGEVEGHPRIMKKKFERRFL